jgi:hypothetical protein
MMNPEIKARWVAWLRANADKQTQGRLCRLGKDGAPDGYCCLGGLSEIAVQDGIITKQEVPDSILGGTMGVYGTFEDGGYGSASHTSLPSAVVPWAGVENWDPKVTVDGGLVQLTYVNDNMRFNFNQIADLIEEQL